MPMTASSTNSRRLVTLGDEKLLEACGYNSPKTLMVHRLRSEQRVAAGGKEHPFPSPVTRIGNSLVYWEDEILAWRERHTLGNNPSRAHYDVDGSDDQ
jgi:hypothetical protein